MSSKQGLLIGGHSGIGKAFFDEHAHTSSVNWTVPSQDELDVHDPYQVKTWFRNRAAIQDYGFDHIVYCAGINQLEWADDLGEEVLADTFKINAFGFHRVLQMNRRIFSKRDFRAVAVVSDAMRNPMRGSLAYCASKAALAAIIKGLAREWAPTTFVAGVAPAVVAHTPMSDYIDSAVPGFRGWTPEQAQAYEASMLPLGRRVTKSEVADTIQFLLTGPSYLSGSIIDLAGGK